MDPRELLKTVSTPKELLRLGVLGFGFLSFLQFAGRADVVGADPVVGPWTSLFLSLGCLVLLEVYSLLQRKYHLQEQEKVAAKVSGGTHPPAPPARP